MENKVTEYLSELEKLCKDYLKYDWEIDRQKLQTEYGEDSEELISKQLYCNLDDIVRGKLTDVLAHDRALSNSLFQTFMEEEDISYQKLIIEDSNEVLSRFDDYLWDMASSVSNDAAYKYLQQASHDKAVSDLSAAVASIRATNPESDFNFGA